MRETITARSTTTSRPASTNLETRRALITVTPSSTLRDLQHALASGHARAFGLYAASTSSNQPRDGFGTYTHTHEPRVILDLAAEERALGTAHRAADLPRAIAEIEKLGRLKSPLFRQHRHSASDTMKLLHFPDLRKAVLAGLWERGVLLMSEDVRTLYDELGEAEKGFRDVMLLHKVDVHVRELPETASASASAPASAPAPGPTSRATHLGKEGETLDTNDTLTLVGIALTIGIVALILPVLVYLTVCWAVFASRQLDALSAWFLRGATSEGEGARHRGGAR